MPDLTCSVIGLGKLGLPLAVILAKRFTTIGVDHDRTLVVQINKRQTSLPEPGLRDLLRFTALSATTDIETATLRSDVTFVIVPTPSSTNGMFSNAYILDVIQKLGAAIAKKTGYHLVNITSTVMPGSTRGEIQHALEQSSGRKLGDDLGLTYNPEFIALGDVIKGIEGPDMVLIGEPSANSKEGDILERIYEKICPGKPHIVRTSFENAEMAKLSLNTFLTMKIAYANTIGEICQAMPNADAREVTRIIGHDSRISPKFLSPGIPFGGPCLPRDTLAFSSLGKSLGVRTEIADATDSMNTTHINWLVDEISNRAIPGSKIGILGLSYKPGTEVTEGSTGIDLAVKLSLNGFEILAFDPLVKVCLRADFARSGAVIQEDLRACVINSDLLVITTACKEFYELVAIEDQDISKKFPTLVFDCWRMFDAGHLGQVKIVHIG